MVNDIPVIIIKDEKGKTVVKELRKAVNSSGEFYDVSFYRLVKNYLFKARINSKLSMTLSPSYIYSNVNVDDVNNVLEKICNLYNNSHFFNEVANKKIPIEIFLDFVNDTSNRTIVRFFNMNSEALLAFPCIEGISVSPRSCGYTYIVDNDYCIEDAIFYIKLKYDIIEFDYRMYTIQDNILTIKNP